MGFAKRELERRGTHRDIGVEIALRTKAIVECEYHEGSYMDNFDSETEAAAYRLANDLYRKRDPLVSSFRTRREMIDAVKAAVEESGEECGWCAKWARE